MNNDNDPLFVMLHPPPPPFWSRSKYISENLIKYALICQLSHFARCDIVQIMFSDIFKFQNMNHYQYQHQLFDCFEVRSLNITDASM